MSAAATAMSADDLEPAAEPPRVKPPNRRRSVRHTVAIGNQEFAVDLGFSPQGRPIEVFITGPAAGSDLAALAHDAATLISVVLQHGVAASELAKSIARVPVPVGKDLKLGDVGAPATIIGTVLDLLARADTEPPLV